MNYLTKEHIEITCLKLIDFYKELSRLYFANGMILESNRGRRNILMSAPMEKFLADALNETCGWAHNDGRTGRADIEIGLDADSGEIRELECKLTSPHSNGTIAFQTDFETLQKKGKLDFVYMIANNDFTGFCVIYFDSLTIEDFRSLSPGSRGKVQMYKHKGMKKATVLTGRAINLNDKKLIKSIHHKNSLEENHNEKVKLWKNEKQSLRPTQVYDRNKIDDKIERAQEKLSKRLNIAEQRIKIVKERKPRYTFKFDLLEKPT